MENKIQDIFLELLRAGLWGKTPSLSCPLHQDAVAKIFTLAQQQTVIGIIADGISFLPVYQRPKNNQLLEWLAYVIKIEKNNSLINEKCDEIALLFQKFNISPIMIKGQGVASLYLNPLHRQCGDIDLYIGDGYKTACCIANKWKKNQSNIVSEHSSFSYHDFRLEIHKHLTHSHILPLTRRLDRWLVNEIKKTDKHFKKMLIPNDEFNCIFVFYHLFHHFMGSGLGFRQLCDWCMCLSKYGKNLDTDELRDKLYSFGMLHSWKVFGYIAVNYLGLNQECMPLYEEYPKCKAEKIIDLIFADGNFGHYSIKRHYSNVYIIQKIYS